MIGTVHGAYITGVKAAQQIAGVYVDSFGVMGMTVRVFAIFLSITMIYAL